MEKHDFQPPPMTPEEYLAHLTSLINRMKADCEWKDLAFFTKHQVQNLDDDFKRMMERLKR